MRVAAISPGPCACHCRCTFYTEIKDKWGVPRTQQIQQLSVRMWRLSFGRHSLLLSSREMGIKAEAPPTTQTGPTIQAQLFRKRHRSQQVGRPP